MAAPQNTETPVPAIAAQPEPTLLASVMDATLSREMNELRYTEAAGGIMAGSGYFADTATVRQAAVKIMLGRELGIAPVVAMMSMHIGKSGRPSLSGALHAALLKRAGYGWKFVKHDRHECTVVPYYGGEPILDEAGKRCIVSFTYDDAKTALLTGPVGESKSASMYDKYGMDMLYNRVLVRIERRFAPEVTKGMVIYTPDELEEIEAKDLDDEMEQKIAGQFAQQREIKAAQEVADRKIAEMKAAADTAETEVQSAVPEAPPLVPARPPEGPRPTMPDTRQRSLTMPARKS